jgi:hypothetical protein
LLLYISQITIEEPTFKNTPSFNPTPHHYY